MDSHVALYVYSAHCGAQPMDTAKLLTGAEAPLKVRLTQLGCGGSILALTLSHALLGTLRASEEECWVYGRLARLGSH